MESGGLSGGQERRARSRAPAGGAETRLGVLVYKQGGTPVPGEMGSVRACPTVRPPVSPLGEHLL